MKAIVFDAGPVISLAMNDILYILKELKKCYDGLFIMTPAVKNELIDRPFRIKRFKLESLQVMKLIFDGTFYLISDKKIAEMRDELDYLGNHIYFYKDNPIKIIHSGETESMAACVVLNTNTFIIDERTTRLLIESPKVLHRLLESKLHKQISVNNVNLQKFLEYTKHIRIVRSSELVSVAFKKGLLNNIIAKGEEHIIPNLRGELIDSLLWGVKLKGCTISEREIGKLEDEIL